MCANSTFVKVKEHGHIPREVTGELEGKAGLVLLKPDENLAACRLLQHKLLQCFLQRFGPMLALVEHLQVQLDLFLQPIQHFVVDLLVLGLFVLLCGVLHFFPLGRH